MPFFVNVCDFVITFIPIGLIVIGKCMDLWQVRNCVFAITCDDHFHITLCIFLSWSFYVLRQQFVKFFSSNMPDKDLLKFEYPVLFN